MGVTEIFSVNAWAEPLSRVTVWVRSIHFCQELQTVQPCNFNQVFGYHHDQFEPFGSLNINFSTTQLFARRVGLRQLGP